ncbi:hypothetical protein JOD69_002525 [Methylocaldum sp. RMAD-M]|jgi:hypothetical protein|nr:hypothetical protein [Methylocaldum sp. RMAD-M]
MIFVGNRFGPAGRFDCETHLWWGVILRKRVLFAMGKRARFFVDHSRFLPICVNNLAAL